MPFNLTPPCSVPLVLGADLKLSRAGSLSSSIRPSKRAAGSGFIVVFGFLVKGR